MSQITIAVDSPYLPIPEYARRTGQQITAVQTDVNRGKLPIRKKKKGEKVEINMLALAAEAAKGSD